MVSWTALAGLAAVLTVHFAPDYSLNSSYLSTATVFILTTWLIKFIYTTILYPSYLTPLKQIPTPPRRSLFLGNTESFELRFPIDRAREWIKTIPNNGLIRYYVMGNRERILVTSPKAISDLLVNKSYDFVRPEIARVHLETFTGEGLLIAEGDVHKAQRKSLMPSFSYRHIKDLYPVFWSKAMQMVNSMEKDITSKNTPEGDNIKISRWSGRAMLDIIGLAGIEADFNSLENPDNELARKYESFFERPKGVQRLIAVLCLFVIGFKWYFKIPSPHNNIIRDGVQYIRDYSHGVMSKKKSRAQQQLKEKGDGAANLDVDILSVAMRSGNFTDDNVVDQMMTFLAAGHETTSSAFQWAVYALSTHPEVQKRLREEVRKAIPSIPFEDLNDIKDIKDENGNIKDTFSDIFTAIDSNNNHNIPYLWAFINEVLRFHPSVPFTSREAARDTVIAGYHVPKGTHVLIAPEVTNKDTDLWGEDAEEFKPERWLNIDEEKDEPLSYNNSGGACSNYANITFVHGPRSCIGQGFARAELAIFVAVFVHRFEFELSDPNKELEVRRSVTQAPDDGVIVKVKKVDL